jgi:hypothetical protein
MSAVHTQTDDQRRARAAAGASRNHPGALPGRDELEGAVRHLAALPRESASPGERDAAEWIARRLRELGCDARVDEEQAHGGYWWPIGLPNAASAIAGAWLARRPRSLLRRAVATLIGAGAAAAIWDDVGGARLWFRRTLLPRRSTWNVVADTGDSDAERTIVVIAHHDAAHSGLVFHPALPRLFADRFPALHARSTQSIPIMYGVWLGSLLVAAAGLSGRRRGAAVGASIAAGACAAMADIGSAEVVPGANDNLSAVAVLLGLAAAIDERPVEGVRVLLVSTGSEESFMEGMQGFARRYFAALDPAHTEMLCVECVGGPTLALLEGEGMLRMRDYPAQMREALAQAAATAGIELYRGLRTVAATDALIGLRRGYRVGTLASVDYTKFPANYHWPSDTPDNLVWESIEGAIAVCDAFVRQSADGAAGAAAR